MRKTNAVLFALFFLALVFSVSGCQFEDIVIEGENAGESPDGGDNGDNGDPDVNEPLPSECEDYTLYNVVRPEGGWVADALFEPKHVHLSWEDSPANNVTLQWQVSHESQEMGDYAPMAWFVKEGTEGLDIENGVMPITDIMVADGSGFAYTTKVDREDTTFYQWQARATKCLEPNTVYYYRVGTWDDLVFDEETLEAEFTNANLSPIYSFKTGLPKGNTTPFAVMLAGDSRGGYEGITQNIDRLTDMEADFWLFNGDMNDWGTQEEWIQWFAAMKPMLPYSPLMPALGNHEQFGMESLFFHQFAMPDQTDEGVPEELKEHAYSFVYGNALFIVLDSTVAISADPDERVRSQAAFLESQLQKANDDPAIVWKILMTHYPVYSASKHGSTQRLIDNWVPIIDEYGVDLVYGGHDHNYERTYPWKNEERKDQGAGTVYLVAGAFYSPGYSAGDDAWTAVSQDGHNSNYAFAEFSGNELQVTAYDGAGVVIDEFVLSK